MMKRWRTPQRLLSLLALAFALLAGVGLRLYDLTDPPLDFYPTRQYRSLILARSFYLTWRPGAINRLEQERRAAGNRIARYEPPLLEALVARTYVLLGEEKPWVIRIYNTLFWLLGALGLGLLARRIHPHPALPVAAIGYWMLLPFTVQVTRAFLPDPLMTVLLVWSGLAWYRWAQEGRGRWLVAAGLLGTAAAVVKIYALFFLLPMGLALAWSRLPRARRPHPWWLAWLLPSGVALPVYLRLHSPDDAAGFLVSWTLKLKHWWLSPMPYGGWLDTVNNALHGGWVLVALLALLLTAQPKPYRAFVLSWLAGYVLYGSVFLIQFATHAYYHLPLVPLIALGLGLALRHLTELLPSQPRWAQGVVLLLLSTAWIYPVGITYWHLRSVDYRPKAEAYRRIGQSLPRDGKIMALTEGYGWPLLYHGDVFHVTRWPTQAHALLFGTWDRAFEDVFRERTRGYDYFLVTDFEEFWRQAPLRHYLYERYPLIHQGGDYLLWDLRRPKE